MSELSRRGEFDLITLDVKPGECLGLYGFVGAGHQELVHALAGAISVDRGEVKLDGQRMPLGDVPSAVGKGVVMVAADRAQTLARRAPIAHNATLAHLKRALGSWIVRRSEHRICRPLLEQVGCRPPNPALRAGASVGWKSAEGRSSEMAAGADQSSVAGRADTRDGRPCQSGGDGTGRAAKASRRRNHFGVDRA